MIDRRVLLKFVGLGTGADGRDVTDLALLDGVITGDNAPLPAITLSDLRLGVHREHFWEDLDSQTTDVMTRVLTTMTDSDAL